MCSELEDTKGKLALQRMLFYWHLRNGPFIAEISSLQVEENKNILFLFVKVKCFI